MLKSAWGPLTLARMTGTGILVAWAAMIPSPVTAQQLVPLKEVGRYTNQRVTVEAKVADARRQRSGEVWLGLERAYPSAPLVVILSSTVLQNLPEYASLKGKVVRVNGIIRPASSEGPPPGTKMGGRTTMDGGGPPPVFVGPGKPSILLEDASHMVVVTSRSMP